MQALAERWLPSLIEAFPFLPPLPFHDFYSFCVPLRAMAIPPNSVFALFLFFMYKYNSDSAVVLLELTTSPANFNFFAKSEFQTPSL